MFAPNNPYFSLSDEGKAEWGHIFTDGQVPIASRKGIIVQDADKKRFCTVDWQKLTDAQQHQIGVKLASKFKAPAADVRAYFDDLGYVPMRLEFVIEAYDLRFFV